MIFFFKNVDKGKFKMVLIFAGSFLFSITIIHILPELFAANMSGAQIGIFVLVGFFLQQILEYFSSGAEHGHIHVHDADHKHNGIAAAMVLISLCLHAFLEGTILAHPTDLHVHHDAKALLTGIALHKLPAAFALMSILTCYLSNKRTIVIYLIIFSMASPLGLILSDNLYESQYLSQEVFWILFAIVSGNFLHISTTIVFEGSPDHHFSARKLLVSIFGAGLAAIAEFLF